MEISTFKRNDDNREFTLITASEGKVFRRKNTEDIFGNTIALGYSYYINGVKLDTPHMDVPEDFEEIDIPEEDINDKI